MIEDQNKQIKIDADNYSPLMMADRKFDIKLTNEEIKDVKKRKIGKVIGS